MAKLNQDKTNRAQLIHSIWERLHYQIGSVNCGTCSHADSKWFKTKGTCNLLNDLKFPISSLGICKMHSSFANK
jgi:hypothetical protein